MELHKTDRQPLSDELHGQATLDALTGWLLTDERPKLVVSDFDDTLCHKYGFDPQTSTSLPVIDPELAATARQLPLIIATGTRAAHPKIQTIWQSGMIAPHGLVITEGGGVILEEDGRIRWSATEQGEVPDLHTRIRGELPGVFSHPENMRLVIKPGMTLLIIRAQRQDGTYDLQVHTELQAALQTIAGPEWSVVDGGRSLSVQRPGITKVNALAHTCLEREHYCLVSLGDSPNDIDLLAEADVAITVGDRITEHGDVRLDADTRAVTAALRSIGRTTLGFTGWRREHAVWRPVIDKTFKHPDTPKNRGDVR